MSTVLGLDLGTNSIGWAIIDDERDYIIDSGVRIFQEGVNNMNSKQEESKNATRSGAKQIRRQYFRKKLRKRKLVRLMKDMGLLPENIEDVLKLQPYDLRKKALDFELTPNELGRVFFHINQRRGYKSNRIGNTEGEDKGAIYDGAKKGGTTKGISELRQAVVDGGFRTIGEYFASIDPHEIRIRDRYTERVMFDHELETIWEAQKKYHSAILTDENKKIIIDQTIMFQRPLKSQKENIGFCTLEKQKRRCPKSAPVAQEFRMLQFINSIQISGTGRVEDSQKMLTAKEREKLIEKLSTSKEISISSMKNTIKLDSSKRYSINYGLKDKIKGLSTVSDINKALGIKDSQRFNEADIFKIWHTLYFAEDDEWLINYIQREWKLTEEQAKKLSKIKLEREYANLSSKAIKKMLPFMRDGMMYHQAAEEVGYSHADPDREVELLDELPLPPHVGNPIVRVALSQLRKLVNTIIKSGYGKIDIIRVEMARDLKNPLQKRMDMLRNNTERANNHERISEILTSAEKPDKPYLPYPSHTDIVKYKLWEECDRICPYTGKSISLNQVYNGEVDIEHILPYSRTLDDSYMNKSLCFRNENAIKGNKTPYEAYGSDEARFSGIKERIKHLPFPKAKRFTQKEIDLDDFISRQLNDTRYISRIALHYLKHVTENVQVGSGMLTDTLKYLWGLNSTLPKAQDTKVTPGKKSREDHRHHALDAIVVACTTRSFLQKMSKYNRMGGNFVKEDKDAQKELKKYFESPWETFRKDTKDSLNNIIISHKPNKRARGQLHEETYYGKLRNPDGTDKEDRKGEKVFVVRKTIPALTPNEIRKIVDPAVKRVVLDRLEEFGVDTIAKKLTIPKDAFNEPLYLISKKTGVATRIKSVRTMKSSKSMMNIRKRKDLSAEQRKQGVSNYYNIWADSGKNHHIVIYEDADGKRHGKVVSLFEAVQRKNNHQAIINKELPAGEDFIMSLQINDMVINGSLPDEFNPKDKSTYHWIFDHVYRVQKMDINHIIAFRRHNVSKLEIQNINGKKENPGRLFKTPASINIVKILVNPAGFIELG